MQGLDFRPKVIGRSQHTAMSLNHKFKYKPVIDINKRKRTDPHDVVTKQSKCHEVAVCSLHT